MIKNNNKIYRRGIEAAKLNPAGTSEMWSAVGCCCAGSVVREAGAEFSAAPICRAIDKSVGVHVRKLKRREMHQMTKSRSVAHFLKIVARYQN